MGILNLNNISFHYTGVMILEDISLELERYEKVGLIGPNGSGKTTLFKIISGALSPVSGNIFLTKDLNLGYLHQQESVSNHNSVYEEALEAFKDLILMENQIHEFSELISVEKNEDKLIKLVKQQSVLNDRFTDADGFTYESRTKAVLKGLGFSDDQLILQIDNLSGGQKTRLELAKLLLQKPDVLLLDEPTNHLDFSSLSWLENFLSEYKGLVIVISHDRYFLDVIVNKIVEIENRGIKVYSGNYTASREAKESQLAVYEKAYGKQQSQINHLKDVVKKLKQFNREKSIKRARSFEKKLDKIDELKKPDVHEKKIRLSFSNKVAGSKDIIHIKDLSKQYGNNILFKNLCLDLYKNDHLFIIGPNGAGKSTLLKILTNRIKADSGTYRIGKNINVGYFDQDQIFDDQDQNLYDEIYYDFPHMSQTQIRNALAGMLFTGDDFEKKIRHLSGGEKSKLSLLKLMLSTPDFIILDEPTNHLDIYSRERLEAALSDFEGTLMVVSHDRYFIKKLANQILSLDNGSHRLYKTSYEEFVVKTNNISQTKGNNSIGYSFSKLSYQETKKKQAHIRRIESSISKLNNKLSKKDVLLNNIENDIIEANETGNFESLIEFTKEKEAIEIDYLKDLEELHKLENSLKEIL